MGTFAGGLVKGINCLVGYPNRDHLQQGPHYYPNYSPSDKDPFRLCSRWGQLRMDTLFQYNKDSLCCCSNDGSARER